MLIGCVLENICKLIAVGSVEWLRSQTVQANNLYFFTALIFIRIGRRIEVNILAAISTCPNRILCSNTCAVEFRESLGTSIIFGYSVICSDNISVVRFSINDSKNLEGFLLYGVCSHLEETLFTIITGNEERDDKKNGCKY